MKNLGVILSKEQQQSINGGGPGDSTQEAFRLGWTIGRTLHRLFNDDDDVLEGSTDCGATANCGGQMT